jgi:hypothetical protein
MIHLAQLLCPLRHCVVACPYEEHTMPAEVEATLSAGMVLGGVDWKCGLCGSTELHFEHGVSRFNSMPEAMAALKECERLQLLTRKAVDQGLIPRSLFNQNTPRN